MLEGRAPLWQRAGPGPEEAVGRRLLGCTRGTEARRVSPRPARPAWVPGPGGWRKQGASPSEGAVVAERESPAGAPALLRGAPTAGHSQAPE